MYPLDLSKKVALVFGVANSRSIAWSIADILHKAGAQVILAYQNERVKKSVEKLVSEWDNTSLIECDVSKEDNLIKTFDQVSKITNHIDIVIHSIAFANKDNLGGKFIKTSQEDFKTAMDISAFSLISIAKNSSKLMTDNGGSILTLTFQASNRVFPGYNIMGTAKAALENEVRQLAYDLGELNIRVNAISAGPLDTLSSRVISHYHDMKNAASNKSPLKRNITHDEVAKTALYLASDLSSGVTGEILHVDAGYNIMGI